MTFRYPYRKGERAAVRAAVTERAGGRCEHCQTAPRAARLILHHERYEGALTLDDMILLCDLCHHARHREPGVPSPPPPASVALNAQFSDGLSSAFRGLIGERTLDEVSLITGISASHLCRIRRGARVPSYSTWARIANAFRLRGEPRDDFFRAAGYVELEARVA